MHAMMLAKLGVGALPGASRPAMGLDKPCPGRSLTMRLLLVPDDSAPRPEPEEAPFLPKEEFASRAPPLAELEGPVFSLGPWFDRVIEGRVSFLAPAISAVDSEP